MKSLFICLEGVDATGKTEISKALAARLGYQYYKSPGKPFADVREIVDGGIDPVTRYFFYRAATQHDSRIISEMLRESGVICDRYINSTFVFHRAMDDRIQSLCDTSELLIPDRVFILTANDAVRAQRLRGREVIKEQEKNIILQKEADRLFKTLGHPVIDTSETTVEQVVDCVMADLKGRLQC